MAGPSGGLGGAGEAGAGAAEGGKAEPRAEGADSLASPTGAAPSPGGARCVLCAAPLALADGTPKLMECLHSACEPCINAKLEERQANSRDFLGTSMRTLMSHFITILICYSICKNFIEHLPCNYQLIY